MSKSRSNLTAKQSAFVAEYLIDLNATQAAIRAGYSARSAGRNADRMMKNDEIKKAIQDAQQQRSERVEVDADYVLRRLVEIDQMDVLDILEEDGSFKHISHWPKIWRQYLAGLDIVEEFSGAGSDKVQTGWIKKIKWPDKVKNLELLGRHVNVQAFKDQLSVDANVGLSDRLRAARERSKRN